MQRKPVVFDTKLFRYKSFQYELKQWNCTFRSLQVYIAREQEKHFGWIFFVPLSQITPTCIETTGNAWRLEIKYVQILPVLPLVKHISVL